MGNCLCNKHRYNNTNKLIEISSINEGSNILLINTENNMKYYLWYDETENITIGMLLTYLKKYLGNHRDFRINYKYYREINCVIKHNMLLKEYTTISSYNGYKNYYQGTPYVAIY